MKLAAVGGNLTLRIPPQRTFVVGRAVDCDLPVLDPTISRHHAELQATESGLRVRDLGSTNGTCVDGERIGAALVPPGTRITFGKVDFDLLEDNLEALDESVGESALDATILRQVRVRGPADIAARLADAPQGVSLLKIAGQSPEERQGRKLQLLLDIAKELSHQADLNRLADKVVSLTFQMMSVDRVALMTMGNGGDLVPRVWRSRVDAPVGSWRVPRSIARKAVEDRVAVLVENPPAADPQAAVPEPQTIRSALCAPLLGGQGDVLGIIYLDNVDGAQFFTEEDLDFLTAFSGMVAVAIENSRLLEAARQEAVVLSNFQRYFAPDLARQIAGERGEIQAGGSKRWVVVLFSDIRGFTSLSEEMSPDEIARLLTEYFTEMVEIVFEHGGTLDKFIGDSLMALWGAPLAREDDADRAIEAAIGMQRTLARLNAHWVRLGRRAISIGIGINVGEVFAGNIGSDRRLEYTVIGDAVNTAARLCAGAGPGEILVAEPLYAALAAPPPVTALEPIPLRGKAQAVPVYRVDWKEDATQERPVLLFEPSGVDTPPEFPIPQIVVPEEPEELPE